MQSIELGSTGLKSTQLGFGCSAVLGRSNRADSLRALDVAWGEGIRFFDTARAYGYGESEALLGEFLQSRRSQAVIATKFGILASPQSAWKNVAKNVARKIVAVAPSVRSLLQKGASTQFSSNMFTIPTLHDSIEESLRKLKTDYVDILLLHSAPASVLEQDDLLEAMGRLVEEGKVRVAGLSAEPEVVQLALDQQTKPLQAMQFPCNVFNISSVGGFTKSTDSRPLLAANHPYGGAARVRQCRELLLNLLHGSQLNSTLRDKLATLDSEVLADVVLNVILRDSGIHVVIPAMMRPEHIRANVQAVSNSRFTSLEIKEIRNALTGTPD